VAKNDVLEVVNFCLVETSEKDFVAQRIANWAAQEVGLHFLSP
jgi:hypothetical protein